MVISLGNFWYFEKLVAAERWSLTRGGGDQRFDCSYLVICDITQMIDGCIDLYDRTHEIAFLMAIAPA